MNVQTKAMFMTAVVFAASAVNAATNPTPITMTSWAVDSIAEASAASPSAGINQAGPFGNTFYEQGAPSVGGVGLPSSGTINSVSGLGATFQIAPYTGNNTAYYAAGSSTPVLLTLTSPGKFTDLSFLSVASNGATLIPTLNFSDTTSDTLTGEGVGNWTVGGGAAANSVGFGAVNGADTSWGSQSYSSGLYMQETDFSIPTGDQTKTLVSISLQDPGASENEVFAVSGIAVVPEPASIGLMGVALTGLLARRRRA